MEKERMGYTVHKKGKLINEVYLDGMNNLKKGDYIYWKDGEFEGEREEIRAVLETLVFTRKKMNNGYGQTEGPFEIEDLITWGYLKDNKHKY